MMAEKVDGWVDRFGRCPGVNSIDFAQVFVQGLL